MMRGKIANAIYYSDGHLTLSQIAQTLKMPPSKIHYHLKKMIKDKLIIKIEDRHYLADVFYLSNGQGIVEKVFLASTEVLTLGTELAEYEGIQDKSIMISVLRTILDMVENQLDN